MAGDWIKVEHVTPDKPEVFRIAEDLGIDADAVVGKLLRIWIWADQQTEDGNADGVTHSLLDRFGGVAGFASALQKVGWVTATDDGLQFVNFQRHNGETAKKRALTSKRVARHRNADRNGGSVTKALPEKRREEYSPHRSPQGVRDRFDEFWQAYPRKVGKKPAREKWQRKGLNAKADEIITDVKARQARHRQWRDGYIPNPATYLHQERWTDEIDDRSSGGSDSGDGGPTLPRWN